LRGLLISPIGATTKNVSNNIGILMWAGFNDAARNSTQKYM